jgi:hypothetical protein
MGNIDRADWHYGGNFPAGLPPENGGTHIGMYLAWVVERGLASARLGREAGPSLQLLRERKITGRHLLLSELDEKFFDGLLTETGRDFTRDYYETDVYFADYDAILATDLPSTYHVEDSWENFDKIAAVIDERFSQWQQGVRPVQSSDPQGQAPADGAGLTREDMLRIAAEVWEGKRPESDLQKYGIRVGNTDEGDAARERLLAELAALGLDLDDDDHAS